MVWDALRELTPLHANKRYLEILQMAAQDGESRVDEALRCLLEQGELGEGKLNKEAVRAWLELTQEPNWPLATQIAVAEVGLEIFDELLGGETAVRS